jgi:hypothetical protein
MDRQATVFVADDMTVSLLGKINLIGIYTSDLVIPTNPSIAGQLVFLFRLEADQNDLFKQIRLQITLPGESPRTLDVTIPQIGEAPTGRSRWFTWHPFLIQQAILRPGHVMGKVVHDQGEILVTSLPWITLALPSSTTP